MAYLQNARTTPGITCAQARRAQEGSRGSKGLSEPLRTGWLLRPLGAPDELLRMLTSC